MCHISWKQDKGEKNCFRRVQYVWKYQWNIEKRYYLSNYWQTRDVSAPNQQWILWLYTKHLMDMFPNFGVRRPLTFGKYQNFHPTRGFFANIFRNIHCLFFQDLKDHRILAHVSNFLFREFYLSLLFKFKIGRSIGILSLMLSMFIITQIIIRIIKKTCFDNTILMVELEGKLS